MARTHIPLWVLAVNLTLSVAVATLGAWVWRLSAHGLPAAQLEALELVHSQILKEHVDPPSSEDLMWAAIEGMVDRLDRHSEFIQPSEMAQFEEDTSGRYHGIGVVMVAGVRPVTVEFAFPGGPAARAGLQVGDQILAVDGKPLSGDSEADLLNHARDLLQGADGSEAVLTVQRGGDTLERVVTRGPVRKPSVKWVRLLEGGKIGYVYIRAFQDHTAAELARALDHLDELAGGKLRGLVLDLRFDRGGLLEQAIAVANQFLASGTIVSLKRRTSEVLRVHEADPAKCTRPRLPVVLLVNGASASASEVVAGALQDHGRAVLIGARTWGKGVVQSIYRWRGLNYCLELTTAHYYTPNGRNIERRHRRAEDGEVEGGIAPDREVALDKKQRDGLYVALYRRYEPPAAELQAVRQLAAKLKFAVPEPPGPDADPQLQTALAEVRRLAQAADPAK